MPQPPRNGAVKRFFLRSIFRWLGAITTTAVDVTITAPEADVLGATVEVKDSKGNVVEVKPADISEGDTQASFEFVTAVAEDALTGVWTVDGAEYNFDEINQLEAITEAASTTPLDEVKLLAALNNAEIENVDTDKLAKYANEINDASPETLADVQKAINEANKSDDQKAEEAAAVKSVVDAENQIQLLNALRANFDFVNADWNVFYKDAEVTNTATPPAPIKLINLDKENSVGVTYDAIQDALNGVNETQVAAAYDKGFKSLRSADVNAARTLANTYLASPEREGDRDFKAYALDSLDVLDALIRVNAATTNNTLKNALVALDNLETQLVEKYKTISHFTVTDDFDIKDVKDNLLANYRKAISDETDVTNKNQRSDIKTIITGVNGTASAQELADLKATVTAGTEGVAANEKAVHDALVAYGIKNVLPTGYLTTTAEAAIVAAGTKDAVQLAVDAANLVEVKAVVAAGTVATTADEAKVETYLKAYGIENVLPTGYLTVDAKSAIASAGNKTAVQSAVTAANTVTNAAVVVKAVNDASTATAARTALAPVALAATASDDYLELTAAGKLEVAELFLAIKTDDRTNLTNDKYTTVADIKTDLENVTDDYKTLLDDVNTATTIAGMAEALGNIGIEAFDSLDAATQLDAAEDFLANYPVDKDGNKVADAYKTLAAIEAALGL